jgi:hypothetical protein
LLSGLRWQSDHLARHGHFVLAMLASVAKCRLPYLTLAPCSAD